MEYKINKIRIKNENAGQQGHHLNTILGYISDWSET